MSDIIVPPLKRCPKCGLEFPMTKEHWFTDRSLPSGLSCHCKSCKTKYSKRYREANREKVQAYFTDYYQKHVEVKRQRAIEWQRNNPERAKLRKRQHYARHREQYKERARMWAKANPEKSKQRARKRNQSYHRRHPEICRVRAHQRRAAGKLSKEHVHAQYKRQRGKCYYCGCKVGTKYHIDHVIPISRGGLNTPDNIVIACPTCNIRKHDSLPHEWPAGGRLL